MQAVVRVIVYRQKNGFWIEVPTMPGCYGEGDNLRDAMDAVRAAILGAKVQHTYSDYPRPN